jgi:hypothetical protein
MYHLISVAMKIYILKIILKILLVFNLLNLCINLSMQESIRKFSIKIQKINYQQYRA